MSEALRQALDPALFWSYRDILFAGLLFNAGIFACSAVAALVVGLLAALLRMHRLPCRCAPPARCISKSCATARTT